MAPASDPPDESGLRIAPATEGTGLDLAFVESPIEGDEVVEEEGARVFVDSDVAPYLDDKVLDATPVGDRVQFSVAEQA